MRPTLDPASESKPDELPSDAKLQAGYIRYIRILPTEGPKGEVCFETCIRRSLSNDDSDEDRISKRLPYTAISYSWGDPTPSHPVIVDGQKRLVATNLWHFLQRANMQRVDLRQENSQRFEDVRAQQADWKSARFESPTAYLEFEDSMEELLRDAESRTVELSWARESSMESLIGVEYVELKHLLQDLMAKSRGLLENWLWIDALCIDQSDARERTHQVGIMSQIFGRADQVVSWVGPEYDNSEHAMATIGRYARGYKSIKQDTLSQSELSEAICYLCERPYWKRLWIFQELRHAKCIILMCGASSISWEQFTHLWRAIVEIATTDEDRSERLKKSLATRMMTLRSKPIDFSLWNLLKET
jgi:hypothetical protein